MNFRKSLGIAMLGAIPFFTNAQTVLKKTQIDIFDNPQDKFSLDGVYLNPADNSLSVYVFRQRLGLATIQKSEKGFGFGSGNKLYPALSVFNVDGDLTLRSETVENYNLNEFSKGEIFYDILDVKKRVIGKHEKDKMYSVLVQEYPNAVKSNKSEYQEYELEVSSDIRSYSVGKKATTSVFDKYSNSLITTSSKSHHVAQLPSIAEGKLVQHPGIAFNKEAGTVSMVAGVRKEPKFNEMREMFFLTYSPEGKLLNQNQVTFDFARSVLFSSTVGEANAEGRNAMDQGSVFIMGKAHGVGKNFNDPSPDNYNLIYLDAKGNEVIRKAFTFVKGKSPFEPAYAFKKDDALYLLARGTQSEVQGYSLLKFTKDAFTSVEMPFQSLNDKLIGTKGEGLKMGYGEDIHISGVHTTSDGGLVLYGQRKNEESQRTPAPAGSAGSTGMGMGGFTKITKYGNYVFLHFDQEGNFKNQYVVKKTSAGNDVSSDIRILQEKNGALCFLSSEFRREKNNKDNEYKDFQLDNGASTIKDNNLDVRAPFMIKLDMSSQKATSSFVDANYVSVHPYNFYQFSREKNELFLVGYEDSQNQLPRKLVLTKVGF